MKKIKMEKKMCVNKENLGKLKFFALGLFVLFGMFGMNCISSVYSTATPNIVLASQNPDPVSPGNFVFLNVKVSNSGDEDVKSATIKMVENNNFKIAQGSDVSKELGIIPAFSSLDSSNNFVIAKFKVFVSEKTPLGLNTVSFIMNDEEAVYEYEFDVLVQDVNPSIVVSGFDVNVIEAGKSDKLVIEVENDNSIVLRDVILSLNLDDVEDEILSIEGGSSQKVISSLKAGEKASVEFDIVVSPDAEAKPYLLPINIAYEDSLGNSFTSEAFGSVQVNSKPQIAVKLDSQDKFTGGNVKATLAIANPGTSTIKGTQIDILDSDDYEVIEGDFHYVGDLNPDDFQTIQAQIFVKGSDNTVLNVKLKYLDAYNNEKEDIVEIPLKVFSDDELTSFGLAGRTTGGSNTFLYFVFLIVLVLVFFVGRRFGYKKGKGKRV